MTDKEEYEIAELAASEGADYYDPDTRSSGNATSSGQAP
jgi:hypothetical protein